MKRFYFLSVLVLALGCCFLAPVSCLADETSTDNSADWRENWRHTNYINLYYSGGVLKMEGDYGIIGSQPIKAKFKSDYGLGFSIGRDFLIGAPIKKVLRFGIQATWFDFNCVRYSSRFDSLATDDYRIRYNRLDLAIGVGPVLVYQPIPKLRLKVYGQLFPVLTFLNSRAHLDGQDNPTDDRETAHITFQGAITAGAALQYSVIGLGFEARWASLESISWPLLAVAKGKNPGWRAYLNFNF